MALTFDTLGYSKHLQDAGIPQAAGRSPRRGNARFRHARTGHQGRSRQAQVRTDCPSRQHDRSWRRHTGYPTTHPLKPFNPEYGTRPFRGSARLRADVPAMTKSLPRCLKSASEFVGWAKPSGRANARTDGVPTNLRIISSNRWWATARRAPFAHPANLTLEPGLFPPLY